MGLAFAESMCRAGERVVAIEADAGHPNIVVARAEGIIVVVGDARDRAVLASARLHKASHLIATADDAVNLEVLVAAQEVVLTRGASVDCLAHATDADVCALLKQQVLESDRDTRFRVDFFNYYDQAAQLLFRREPPDGDVTVVIGSGRLADAVVLAASAIVRDGSREGSGQSSWCRRTRPHAWPH